MQLPERRLRTLETLGLSPYQARAYLTLLEAGPATARAVSEASGVPRGKVYATLNDLHARGLVTVVPDRPRTYVPRPVAELLADLRRRHREALERIAREEEALVRAFRPGRAATPPPPGPVTILRGRRSVLDRVRALAASAEDSIVGRVTAAAVARLADDVEAAAERGVDVTLLAPSPARRLPSVRAVDTPAAGPGVSILVFDGAVALVQRAVPDDAQLYRGDDLGVLVADSAVARALGTLVRAARATPPIESRR